MFINNVAEDLIDHAYLCIYAVYRHCKPESAVYVISGAMRNSGEKLILPLEDPCILTGLSPHLKYF